MNRLEFLKDLKNSLVKTVQYVNAPILEGKIEKWELSLDLFSQMEWRFVSNQVDELKRIEEKYIDGKSIMLVHHQERLRAFSGTCPSCGNLLIVLSEESKCKCMHCETEYLFLEKEGKPLLEYPLKITGDGVYVGLVKKKSMRG